MRYFKGVFAVLIFSFLVLTVHADDFNPLIYQYSNPDVTVEFYQPLEVSAERQQAMADNLAGIMTSTPSSPVLDSPNNIICTIFGHDIAPQSTVTATHHKVEKYNPRCLMKVYHVTYCKRCDYTVTELDNEFYIACCPED
jgi:hypothetical protein